MSWPWLDSSDLDRCARDLAFSSTISDGNRLLEEALEAFRAASGRLPLPWPSWGLRLPALFQSASSPELFAAAIALLTSPASDQPAIAAQRLSLALWQLEQLGIKREQLALLVLDCQLLGSSSGALPGSAELEADGIERNLALLWGLAALVAKVDPQPWLRFATALAAPIALYTSLVDLIDDTPREELPPLRLGGLLRACQAEDAALSALLDGCAGGFGYIDRLAELRAALGNEAILRQLRAHRTLVLTTARAALPEQSPQPGAAFLGALESSFAALDSQLWTCALMARALRGPSDVTAQSALSLRAAVDFLHDTAPWRSAWDVHRFHPMGAPGVLYGRGFIDGLILLALSEITSSKQAEIAALLERVPAGDARYFPDWTGLPPDADSLGLLLQLATRLDAPPRDKLDSWIAVLDLSLDETRVIPVWLERGPQGATASLAGPFMGNDCTAVRLAFLFGAIRYDAQRFAPLLRSNLLSILPRLAGHHFAGSFHYASPFAVHMFVRLAQVLCASALPAVQALCSELALESHLTECARSLTAAQRIDGGWGSPQQTALAITALAGLRDTAAERLMRGMKYLGDTQSPDGAWPAESLYITPGKHGGMVPFGAKEVTTALCAQALHAAYNRVGGEALVWSG